MAIDATRINTAGAVVKIGGTVSAADSDGYYIGTTGGVDVGCTRGGITVEYSFEKTDIFCDQTVAPVSTSVTSESCTITFNLLESDVENLQYALGQMEYMEDAGVESKLAVGGVTEVNFVPLVLEVPDNSTGNLTTYTFYKVATGGASINFERDNATEIAVTFTAYADTAKTAPHQLFSVHQDLS